MTRLYFDNDIVYKLASCNLLDDATEVLASQRSQVCILSTLKYRLGKTSEAKQVQAKRELGNEAFELIDDFLDAVEEIAPAKNNLLLQFEDLPAIDSGEAQIYAAACDSQDILVVTGDKRSLRCLATADCCRQISKCLSGRVLCFEQLIRLVIEQRDFDFARQKIVPAVDCDTALRAAFGSGLDSNETQVVRVLDAYINDLRRETGELLMT